MKKITFPLKRRMKRPTVGDLQDVFHLLLDQGLLIADDETSRRELSKVLKEERAKEYYGKTTSKMVGIFQEEHGLQVSGEVDKLTAEALNTLVHKILPMDKIPALAHTTLLDPRYRVVCKAVDSRGKPISDLHIEAFDQDTKSPHDPLGEPSITDENGKAVFRFRRSDFSEHPGERGPDLYFEVRLGEIPLDYILPKIKNNNGVIRNYQQQREPIIICVDKHYIVTGVIVQQNGLPADKLTLSVHRLGFGGDTSLIGSPNTDDQGCYTLTYDPGESAVNLEIRIKDPQDAKNTIPLIKPHLKAAPLEILNLVVPSVPMKAEYHRLSSDLTKQVGKLTELSKARENADRRDITMAYLETGWDARLIALAATTERMSAEPDIKLPKEGLYGLLRAGLPSDKMLLAQVDPDVAEQALITVRDAGIVELSEQQIKTFKKGFISFCNTMRRKIPAPGSGTTYGKLLKTSGVPQDLQDKFLPLYLNHHGDAIQLWEKAQKIGLGNEQIQKLKLHGKLAYITGNSLGMTEKLFNIRIDQKQINNPEQLVEKDLYHADVWVNEVYDQAGIPADRHESLTDADKKKLDDLIPTAYTAEKVDDRLRTYAEDMARKIRLSYPTQVLVCLMEKDENFKTLSSSNAIKLLKNLTESGFRLGSSPLSAFFNAHPEITAGLQDSEVIDAQKQLLTLRQIYQITPSNEAMPVLKKLNIISAYDVMMYSEADFSMLYERAYLEIYGVTPPQIEAELIYRKSTQVSSVTYNLFAIASKVGSEPQVASIAAPAEVHENVRSELIKQFPTMESLFGSMDFCECEHCRSVLSPGAYLVDLLQFIDPESGVWTNYLETWKETHSDNDYPHRDENNNALKPYDVLKNHRPDIPHIPLTCENTHTALPYIDIVNEILEYFVANGKLDEKAAQDTGDATTDELLAEPQNIVLDAYEKLRKARYPLNLPFDLWIETVRQFCDYTEMPLDRVLETIRKSDALCEPAQPYDRATIFMESLRLSPNEVALYTESDPLVDDKWHELFGLPSVRPTLENPTNTEHATVRVNNEDAGKYMKGLTCTYFDVSVDDLSAEYKTISAIGDLNSGGADKTIITLNGEWNSPPDDGDNLVCDGAGTLKSGKTLSRRLGVTYKEIKEIIQTGFVNPELTELILLYKLGVAIQDVRFYINHKFFYEQNKDLVGTNRDDLPDADQLRFDALSDEVPNTGRIGWEIVNELYAFEMKLEDLATKFNTQSNDLKTYIQNISFSNVLVLVDPDAGCNFDLTTLQYADSTKADPIVFLRINLFVRLWQKLGWSIEETDRALCTFIPKTTPYDKNPANLAKQPLKTALIYLAHLKALDEKVNVGKQGRLKLLTLWSDIATSGKKPLYAQLFLTRSVLMTDPIFDHHLGKYLQYFDNAEGKYKPYRWDPNQPEDPSTGNVSMLSHLLTLQGALSLNASEINRILTDAGLSVETAELSLKNISLLYKYGLFAKGLKLSVRELISLKQLSGLNPFKSLISDPLVTIDEDHPFSHTLRLVDISEEVKESGLKVEDLDYLLRHRFDETGKYRPDHVGMLVFLKTLADGIRVIRVENSLPDEPSAQSEDELRNKLSLAYKPDVVETLMAMINGTVEFTSTTTGVEEVNKLELETFEGEERILGLSYKEVPHKEQKITIGGVLFDSQKTELQTRYNAPLNAQQKIIFAELLGGVQKQAGDFFVNNLKKHPLRDTVEAGFLEEGDFNMLFYPLKPLKIILPEDTLLEIDDKLQENESIEQENQETLENRYHRLAQTFLPYLQQRLIRQFVVQSMTEYTGADPVLTESLVTDVRLLVREDSEPLVDTISSIGERGISAAFYDSDDLTGATQPIPAIVQVPDTDLKVTHDTNGNPLNSAQSAHFEGFLEVPVPGTYRFYIELEKQNAVAELRFNHRADPVFLKDTASADNSILGDQQKEFIELKAGIPYHFSLELKKLDGGGARMLVQGETLPKGSLSQLTLYPLSAMISSERAILLLQKSLHLIQGLSLSEREILYLLMHADKFDNIELKTIPVRDAQQILDTIVAATMEADNTLSKEQAMLQARNDNPDLASEADLVIAHFNQFLRVATYVQLKKDLAAGTNDLIDIFEANTAGDLNKVYSIIAKLTRREEAVVKGVAENLWNLPSFSNEQPLQRLWEVLQVVERFGASVNAIMDWTNIVSQATSAEQGFTIARDLKETIKARYEPDTWQRVTQPIFDNLRKKQRDALVSYLLDFFGFTRMEQLYEQFLIDPGMEPVVQTSRIRLAIASVQLFIQRSLLNLEPLVHPSTINSKHWEWMKRYRVWEANRKIFLYPENWLEPEFRDNKTHLFAELEGTLLQDDVSSDLVEDAFFNYLKKLEELARLNIVAMHIEDNPDPTRRTLHVFGRTYSKPHNYFYRRYVHNQWTPWEPVSAEIEGDHLAPVIWRDRLYLFWVTFMDKPVVPKFGNEESAGRLIDASFSDLKREIGPGGSGKNIDVQLHWSEYLNNEWSPKISGDVFPVMTYYFNVQFVPVVYDKLPGNNSGGNPQPPSIGSSATPEGGVATRMYFDDPGRDEEQPTMMILPLLVPYEYPPQHVFIHVSKETYENGHERGVFIHLTGPNSFQHSFYLAGRNSGVEEGAFAPRPVNPYNIKTDQATVYSGRGALKVDFKQHISSDPEAESGKETLSILQQGDKYTLLPSDNNLTVLTVPEEILEGADNPDAVKAAIEAGLGEIESLIKPFFYQDNKNTFYVNPEVTEETIEEWEWWVTRTPQLEPGWINPIWWEELVVIPQYPLNWLISDSPKEELASEISLGSLINPKPQRDWLVNSGTFVQFDDAFIGQAGKVNTINRNLLTTGTAVLE